VKFRIGIWLMLLLPGMVHASSYYAKADSLPCDSGQLSISIECTPLLAGEPLQNQDLIIATYDYDTIFISDTILYNALSDNTMTLPGLDLTFVDGYMDYLHFSIFSKSGSCLITDAVYHYNESLSNSCYVVVDNLAASAYDISYPDNSICMGADSIFPITNVPNNAIQYTSDSLLCMTDEGVIIPAGCRPGNYTVFFGSEYCLSSAYSNIDLVEMQTLDLPDTLTFCSGDLFEDGGEYERFTYYSPETFASYDLSEIPSDGEYIVTDETGSCKYPDTVYIKLVESPVIDFNLQQECDRVIVGLNSPNEILSIVNWTNGDRGDQVEIDRDTVIGVTITNREGCSSTDSVRVEVKLLEIPDVQYDKTDATCWLEGNISISSSTVNNNVGTIKYQLRNTINNRIYNTLDDIPEGVYSLEVVDERNCVAKFNQQIEVLQHCLEDYPVFTPNGDDIEDSYFIPYEGSVKIYNVKGSLVRKLTTPAYWDGNDDSGNPLPMGTYAIITDSGKIVNITIVK
jgi:hypothetical protein